MGLIRKTGVLLISSILLFSIFLTGLFLTLDYSLDYNVIQPELQKTLNNLIAEQPNLDSQLQENIENIKQKCENLSQINISEYGENYSIQELPIDLNCDSLNSGTSGIINSTTEALLNETYYKEYDCKMSATNLFIDCIKKTGSPFFLISKQAQNYWNSKFRLFLFLSLFLAVTLFFLTETKSNSFLIAGILTLIAALPLMKIELLSFFFKIDKAILDVFLILFKEAYSVFLTMFFIGSFLIIGAILFKFFNLGLKISSWFVKKDADTNIKPKQ